MTIALVTDSNSQITSSMMTEHGVRVVPIPITVDGVSYLEGETITADEFFAMIADVTPTIETSLPSPGAFAEIYELVANQGATEILSVHVGKTFSGTLNSARLGAALVDVPVRLVDTGTASFGVACCVAEAGRAIAAGDSIEVAASAAEALAGELWSVSALGVTDLLMAGGRGLVPVSNTDAVQMFTSGPQGAVEAIGAALTVDAVCDRMADVMHLGGRPIRVALGIADPSAHLYSAGLRARLEARHDVVEIVDYRIGPSIAAFTGPGVAGGFWYPA